MISFKRSSILLLLVLFACAEGPGEGVEVNRSRVDEIIDSAITFHGGERYDDMRVSFRLRNRDYSIYRRGGNFSYTSLHSDSLGTHRRELSNAGFVETIDGKALVLNAKDSLSHAESVNSVVYFTLLPVFLKDPAVFKTLDGKDTLDQKIYHRVKVTFAEQGGGADHDDVYYYWFDADDYSMDFLAYSFTVNDGGSRFRKAINMRRINGIVFQDFENYKGPAPDSLAHIAGLYKDGGLKLLSTVEINQISVSKNDGGR